MGPVFSFYDCIKLSEAIIIINPVHRILRYQIRQMIAGNSIFRPTFGDKIS